VCVVESAPPPSPAGTSRGVVDRPAGTWTADPTGDPDDTDTGDDGAAVPCPWLADPEPGDPEHAAAAAMTAAASSATVKLRPGTVMAHLPVPQEDTPTPPAELGLPTKLLRATPSPSSVPA
jgi:hypothetical protein